MTKRLTSKQQKFVEAYVGEAEGNGTKAAQIAGYANAPVMACQNLKKSKIVNAIDSRRDELREAQHKHLSPEQIHAMWYEIAHDPDTATGHRIRALKLAARSQGMFIDRQETLIHSDKKIVFSLGENDHDDD